MNIAFLHYHSRKGGVTTVIGQQIAALRDRHDCLMLQGEEGGVDFGIPRVVIDGLGYNNGESDESKAGDLADRIVAALRLRWGDQMCDVLHIHNPLLGKNSRMLACIRVLRDRGLPLFLQVHDFAEDGRPSVYFRHDTYPADCHYGVINRRDYRLLLAAGLKEAGLHYLPNMVSPLPYGESDASPDLVLYPVRGIRRKNLGELLLLAFFAPDGVKLGTTLPPTSERDKPVYEHWKRIAAELALAVEFELGTRDTFPRILGRTLFVVTTSVKEGFGFSFLEPWTIGKEVRGRRLDAVCPDFEDKGVRFPLLYSSFRIPEESFNSGSFRDRWKRGIAAWSGAYELTIPDGVRDEACDRLFSEGPGGGRWVDFARIDERAQEETLRTLAVDLSARQATLRENVWLSTFFTPSSDTEIAKANRAIILDAFGERRYREHLLQIYPRIKEAVPHGMEKEKVLNGFLQIDNWIPIA